jgi:hypothetical protein
MTADERFGNLVLGPSELTVLFKVFDEAWEIVRSQYATSRESMEAGRLHVANVVLGAHGIGARNSDLLRATVSQLMNYTKTHGVLLH